MTALRQRIEKRFRDCLAVKCEKDGCSLAVDRKSRKECTIIDCDTCSNTDFPSNRCDYILFHWGKSLAACVLELKGGNIGHVDHCLKQIQAGLDLVAHITSDTDVPYCRPVLLHGSGASNPMAIKTFANKKDKRVNFRGRKFPIFVVECGAQLHDILLD